MAAVLASTMPATAAIDLAQREMEKESKTKMLRERLEADEAGPRAAAQLVQGGELECHGEMTSDAFLQRWLRARAWDVQRAYDSILRHAEWRATNMPNGRVEPASISTELACEKVYIQGCDRQGRPIMILQVRKHNGWTRSLEEMERLCCHVLDQCVVLAKQRADVNPKGQVVALLDLTDVGAVSLDMQAIKSLFTLLGEHYVERLGAMYFFNPPYIFWGAWNTLSPLLPEPTRAKVKVVDATQGAQELLEMVDPSVLPVEYGGNAPLAAPLGRQ